MHEAPPAVKPASRPAHGGSRLPTRSPVSRPPTGARCPRRAARRRARTLLRAGLLATALPALAACGADDAPEATPTAVTRDAGLAPAAAASATPAPTARPTPRPLRLSLRALGEGAAALPGAWGAADVLAGPWAPDGRSLVAYRVSREDPLRGPVGRVGVVDADGEPAEGVVEAATTPDAAPALRWESGDVEGPIDGGPLAAWRADGTLVLARPDRPFVDADGAVVAEIAGGFGDQVRAVEVAPNGRTALLAAATRAWILDAEGLLRPISGLGGGGLGGWDWRFDARELALSVAGEGIYVVEAETGRARRVAAAPDPEIAPAGPPPAPRWLADGRLLLPVPGRSPGVAGLALGVADPSEEGGIGGALHGLLGLPPNPEMPRDASDWVSPDGRYVLYPEVVHGPDGPAIVARWLWDVAESASTALPPLAEPLWSPDGRRFALLDGGLRVVETAGGAPRALVPADVDVGRAQWSRDGAWLVFAGAEGAPWLVAADGSAGPERIDEGLWVGDATWSPGGERFALALRSQEGPARLNVARFEIGR